MKSALTSILKIADLLTKKAFVVAFYDESCRFGNKPWLFEKLRKDMLFQWNQMGFDRTIDLHGDADPKTIREAAQATAVGLAEWANRTADNRGIKILKKDTRLGTVNPDEVGELLLKVLSWEVMAEAKSADDIHRPSMFYYWNTLHSFRTFFKAKKTVTEDTGNKAFESVLQKALNNEKYVTGGYPHDLLVHDVESLEKHKGKKMTLMIREDYLSTHMVDDKSKLLLTGNTDYLKIAV